MGHYELEILISAGLLACMVIAALMCDLLKGKNEQLREMMAELKVRSEEVSRREQLLLLRERAAAPVTEPASVDIAVEAVGAPLVMGRHSAAEVSQPEPARAANSSRRPQRANGERKRELSPDAVSAIERGLQMAADPKL